MSGSFVQTSQLRRLAIPLALLGGIPASMAVAAAIGGDPLMAAAGAALVLVHWAMSVGFDAIAQSGSPPRAAVASAVGMVVRYVVIGGALLAVALLDRDDFPSCVVAFLALFTVLLWVRIGRSAVGTMGRKAS
jgi:hypothetical protein